MNRLTCLSLLIVLCVSPAGVAEVGRKPTSETELRRWLENMIVYHHYSTDEVHAATALAREEIQQAVTRFNFQSEKRPNRTPGAPLLMLPYPGGRHPRIGFLDGAVDPQRETKISIFTPWDERSYVVADVPEAIWSNSGLTYLAHTHVPTLWTKQSTSLPPLEWEQLPNGDLRMERSLPNGIRFGTHARSTPDMVLMKMWLSNGTAQVLSDLRVQNCVMLKGASGFTQQTNANKILRAPFAACRSETGDHWVITAWKPIHRAWANAPVPCLHADPKFPDTQPGQTSTNRGLVAFYTGKDIEKEFERIEKNWEEWMKALP
jgi:hypothetical protein